LLQPAAFQAPCSPNKDFADKLLVNTLIKAELGSARGRLLSGATDLSITDQPAERICVARLDGL
jgi:hypothetical protein